jgi:hypothetical protein
MTSYYEAAGGFLKGVLKRAVTGLPEEMTKKERRQFMFGAIKAAIALWATISAGMILFVLFCVFVWLR